MHMDKLLLSSSIRGLVNENGFESKVMSEHVYKTLSLNILSTLVDGTFDENKETGIINSNVQLRGSTTTQTF